MILAHWKHYLNNILVEFGTKVKLARTNKKISQEKLGELSGLHRTYIGMIERGEKNITLLNIQKISQALELPISHFFQDLS